jgi:polar amino acid transport system substrate-binding protein
MKRILPVVLLLTACGAEGPQQGTSPLPSSCESSGVAAPAGPTVEGVKKRGALVVALEAEFKPFEYLNEKGEIAGFDVDLARILARELGVKLEIRNVAWESIIPELSTKKADLIASGMTVTEERAKTVAFSEPYFYTVTALLVSRERASNVHGVADLDRAGRVVVVKQGTTGETAANAKVPRATIRSYPTENAAALEVAQGRADAFLYDLASVRAHHEQHPKTTFLITEPVTFEPYAVATRPGDPAFVAWVNQVLAAMRAKGCMKELYARHGLEDHSPPR